MNTNNKSSSPPQGGISDTSPDRSHGFVETIVDSDDDVFASLDAVLDSARSRKRKKPMRSHDDDALSMDLKAALHDFQASPPKKKKRASPKTYKDVHEDRILVPAVELPVVKPKPSYRTMKMALDSVQKMLGYEAIHKWLGWFYTEKDETYPLPYVIWNGGRPYPLPLKITRALFPSLLSWSLHSSYSEKYRESLRLLLGERETPTAVFSPAFITWEKVKEAGLWVDTTREFEGQLTHVKSPITSRQRLEQAFHRLHPTSTRYKEKKKKKQQQQQQQQGSVGESESRLDEILSDFSSRPILLLPLYAEGEELPLPKEALEKIDRKLAAKIEQMEDRCKGLRRMLKKKEEKKSKWATRIEEIQGEITLLEAEDGNLMQERQRKEVECEAVRKRLKENEDTKSRCDTHRQEIQRQWVELAERDELAGDCHDLLLKVMTLPILKTFRDHLEQAIEHPGQYFFGHEEPSSNSDQDTSDDGGEEHPSSLIDLLNSDKEPEEEESSDLEATTAAATPPRTSSSKKRRRPREKSPDGMEDDRHYYQRKNKELEKQEELLKNSSGGSSSNNNKDAPKETPQKPQKRRRSRRKRKKKIIV